MKLVKSIITAGMLAGIAACATQSPPEGGPKDEKPPKLVSSNPKDQQLNVDTRTIRLMFDEEVQPASLNKELLITPNINNPYKVITKRNELTLEFEKPLEDSTTYTLNFRNGITDITEKNKAQGLRLSFSTGAFIDSSRVSGQVVDLLLQTPVKDAVVALYRTEDTLTIRKNRPYYLTTTDAQGSYSLQNVKQGNYRIYAIVDKNNNSFYDSEAESIAYLTAPIAITPETDSVKLQTVRIDTKKPLLLARNKFSDRLVANYNEGIQQFVALSATGKDTLVSKIAADGKFAELFKTSNFSGGKAIVSAVDSAGNIGTDTLNIAFEGQRASRITGAQVKVLNTGGTGGYTSGQPVVVELQTPVRIVGKAPLRLMADSTLVQELTYPEQVSLDRTNTELRFNMPALTNNRIRQLTVVLDTTAVVPLEGGPLTIPALQLSVSEAKGTGTISGRVNTAYTSYTVQLLNNAGKLVKQQQGKKTYKFDNVVPGTYRIRVLIDANKNGKWDSADPTFEQAPEPVYIHPKTFEVRANWEIENENLEF
ncbi:Ig-like domain-containing protein [Pontibacter akesuensis]|uniref:Carboxypeptidase regulatory-like domain-containing protein n=1 Tax=Pontibacter akesuensis TaxID=388950 RepID=A0A1I7I126_9BACT|nr:Ig-like domain-containing protein [Pontibacter akesuensis]GHA64651.1 hypothetical protein GCM10007389_16710 [Pontibacter akesuensis]SFU66662.1 Carboxypeptidase regulatory-like domain-containing protein [Pontibacter akesuensis]